MKRSALVVLSLAISFVSLSLAAEFGYPVNGEPWYFLKANFAATSALGKGFWKITWVQVNNVRIRDFTLFQSGEETLRKEIDGELPFDLKARLGWQAGKEYELTVQLENTKTKKTATLSTKTTAPAQRGYWNPDWKNYMALIVAEEHGIQRADYPVHATVGLLSNYIKTPDEVRVVKAEKEGNDVRYTEIPCQVYDFIKWEDKKILAIEEKDEKTGERITRYHPTTSLSVAFLANLKPREKATYLVCYNNPAAPKPAYTSDLKVQGTGIGKTVANKFYCAVLNKKSGVLYEITDKPSKIRLEHKLETNGSIHWNPCVYSPPHAWYHTSDWENPPFVEVNGPVFYSIRIAAPLPSYPSVLSSVTYNFYANTPFILVQTTIEITDDLFVQALRNGEIVFDKAVFKNVGYKTMAGEVKTIDLSRTRMHPDHVISLRPDTPWVTFYNEDKGIAFANLYLDLTMTNVEGGEASAEQPFVYIQHGPWYYLARGLVYSFGTNNQTRMLPVRKGSVYYEKNVFYPFSFKKDQGYRALVDKTFDMLKYPLSIAESIETYLESPEGWVVPILTEPFEEGVKEARGGKKKNER
jgi:hypothetical protein